MTFREDIISYETSVRMGRTKKESSEKFFGSPDAYQLIEKSAEYENVKTEINMKMQEAFLTLEDHLEKLAELRDDAQANGKFAAAVSAEVSRGRAAGLYTNKTEISLINEETMSEEELMRRIQQLRSTSGSTVQSLTLTEGVIDAEFTER